MKTLWWKVNGYITKYTPVSTDGKKGEGIWTPTYKLALI